MNKNRKSPAKKSEQRNLKIMISAGRKLFSSPADDMEIFIVDTLASIPACEYPLVNIRAKSPGLLFRA